MKIIIEFSTETEAFKEHGPAELNRVLRRAEQAIYAYVLEAGRPQGTGFKHPLRDFNGEPIGSVRGVVE